MTFIATFKYLSLLQLLQLAGDRQKEQPFYLDNSFCVLSASSFLLAFSSLLPWIRCLFNIPLRAIQEAPSISRRRWLHSSWASYYGKVKHSGRVDDTADRNRKWERGGGGPELRKIYAHFLGNDMLTSLVAHFLFPLTSYFFSGNKNFLFYKRRGCKISKTHA